MRKADAEMRSILMISVVGRRRLVVNNLIPAMARQLLLSLSSIILLIIDLSLHSPHNAYHLPLRVSSAAAGPPYALDAFDSPPKSARARGTGIMSPAEVYEHLAGLLHPQSSSSTSRHRSSSEISDGLKRIRRSVLTEGIPEVVRVHVSLFSRSVLPGEQPLRPRGSGHGHDAIVLSWPKRMHRRMHSGVMG
jgi:hypothetical protein